ncbi:glycosyltransferase family 4 protein [uncultured Christiangramia sp.]|uniref:glycosyltransferase family 4 protein n=1 Tax=uncultured Christiangramia sp. TaxID=503836 RepID=UPI00262EC44E|nr:glycosyltransferase family 4 protein [uncultured Christiangramia sp.]
MKQVAVVCNYKLNPSRIGGMDRFFVAYDRKCKAHGCVVKWFFSSGKRFSFYKDLDIEICRDSSVENCFLKFQRKEKREFDFVVTHFVELCTSFFRMVKNNGQPYVISVDHNPRPLNGFPLNKRMKNKLKGRLNSKYIDRFIGVSKYTRNHILNDYGHGLRSKTEVIYNGIDTDVYKKRAEENFGKFIVASHLRPSKGIQDLIHAVAILPTEFKNLIEIDIFGEGPMEEELKEMVKNRNLIEHFNFKGSSPDLPDLFQHYFYMLQPTYMECFSLSILESLASNVPVITTPVGGNTEVIVAGQNGFIFEAGNVLELSNIIEEILLKKRTISKPVHKVVEENYYLNKMVGDHAALLNL